MSKIARIDSDPNLSSSSSQIDSRQVLDSLSTTRRQIDKMEKFLEWATSGSVHKLDHDWAYDETRIEATIQQAQSRVDKLPNVTDIQELIIKVAAVVEGKAEPKAMKVLVGIMLDGFKAKPNDSSDAFVTALFFMLEDAGLQHDGYSPEVIVSATRLAWMASPFQPSISEFLEHLDKAQRKFMLAAHRLTRLLELRHDAELTLHLATIGDDDFDKVPF